MGVIKNCCVKLLTPHELLRLPPPLAEGEVMPLPSMLRKAPGVYMDPIEYFPA